jgi:hypothetical protein
VCNCDYQDKTTCFHRPARGGRSAAGRVHPATRAHRAPTAQDAAAAYVAGLTEAQLIGEAGRITQHQYAYRRAIMKALRPDQRAHVWREHLYRYVRAYPNLEPAAMAAINAAAALAVPETFQAPTAQLRVQIATVAADVEAQLGREVAEYLLYRLGPKDGQQTTVEPVTDKLAAFVRETFVALAMIDPCHCSTEFGCEDGMQCSTAMACTPVTEWPACGWLWMSDCDGLCRLPSSGG